MSFVCASPRGGRRGLRTAVCAALLACVVALTALDAPVLPLVHGRQIKIADMVYTTTDGAKNMDAIRAGFMSPFYKQSYKVADHTVEFIRVSGTSDNDDVVGLVEQTLAVHPDLLTIMGPYSDERARMLLESSVLTTNNLTMIAPVTTSQDVRYWTKNAYFTRADPATELYALLDHIGNTMQVRRVGMMHLTGINVNDDSVREVERIAQRLPLTSLYTYQVPAWADFNEAAFNELASHRPQAIFVFGNPGQHTAEFITRALTDPRTAKAVYLGNSVAASVLRIIYEKLSSSNVIEPFDGQIVASTTTHLLTETQFQHIRVCREELAAIIKSGTIPSLTLDDLENPLLSSSFVSGWVAGRILRDIVSVDGWTENRTNFMDGIFSQNRFLIEQDWLVGDYGGVCSPDAKAQGAMCECNQGGRVVNILMQKDGVFTSSSTPSLITSPSQCYLSGKEIPWPIGELAFNLTDVPMSNSLSRTTMALSELIRRRDVHQLQTFALNTAVLNTSTTDLDKDFANYANDYRVMFVSGLLVEAPSMQGVPHIGAMHLHPRPNAVSANESVYIVPTLEQQLFVCGMYLSDHLSHVPVPSRDVGIVLMQSTPEEAEAILDAYDKTVLMYSLRSTVRAAASPDTPISSLLQPVGTTFVIGISEGDPEEIAAFLEANPDASVILNYNEFVLHYEEFLLAFSPRSESARSRFLTPTNMPLWTARDEQAYRRWPILANFVNLTGDSDALRTPYAIQSYITMRFVQLVMSQGQYEQSILDTIYEVGTWIVEGFTLSDFKRDCESQHVSTCRPDRNYGAYSIGIISMQRVLDPSYPETFESVRPSMTYTVPPRPRDTLATGTIVGIVLGAFGLVVVVVLLIVVPCLCCSSTAQANRSAPKDGESPVSLVFTDIESSTALWAAVPQLMSEAVATHHRLIRQVIHKYKCYEVKTIGDSFMIACKDAFSAVQLAREVQLRLLRHDWGTTELDSCYRAFEMRKRDELEDYSPPTAMLHPEVYQELWNGLRVRIGIHTGLSDIRCDERTGGYDYYGETSNMAARTEAIGNGGQVLLSESTYWALSHAERAELNCVSLGPQGLRGVPYSVEMFQLNAVPGRRHVALRTEIDAILPNDEGDDGTDNLSDMTGTDALLSSLATLSGPAASIASVLKNCFSPYTPAAQTRELQPLLRQWKIPLPPRNRGVPDADYAQGMINRLAVKMAAVAQVRMQRPGSVHSSGCNTVGPASRRFTGTVTQGSTTELNIAAVSRLPHAPGAQSRAGNPLVPLPRAPRRSAGSRSSNSGSPTIDAASAGTTASPMRCVVPTTARGVRQLSLTTRREEDEEPMLVAVSAGRNADVDGGSTSDSRENSDVFCVHVQMPKYVKQTSV